MRIGIDVSQLAYQNTGVANYLSDLVLKLIDTDRDNEYILFFSALRRRLPISFEEKVRELANVRLKKFSMPPAVLDVIWNRLHILPIENLLGGLDVFLTSDWAEPPVRRAKKITIIYDLIVYKHPEETDQKIISVQKRKLAWVKKESNIVFCISESTKSDVENILGIQSSNVKVIYPGIL